MSSAPENGFRTAKKELCPNRLWLLGMIRIEAVWLSRGTGSKSGAVPDKRHSRQSKQRVVYSSLHTEKFSSVHHFTQPAIPPQYKIAKQKKMPSERQYPRFKRRPRVPEP